MFLINNTRDVSNLNIHQFVHPGKKHCQQDLKFCPYNPNSGIIYLSLLLKLKNTNLSIFNETLLF